MPGAWHRGARLESTGNGCTFLCCACLKATIWGASFHDHRDEVLFLISTLVFGLCVRVFWPVCVRPAWLLGPYQ